MKPITLFIKRHPLAAFFGLAFMLEWLAAPLAAVAPELPPFIFTFLPALSALLVVALAQGRPGVKALLRKLTIWRVGYPWYAVALGLPLLVGLLVAGLMNLLTGSDAVRDAPWASLPARLLFFSAFAVGEELGWRGYALPRLLERYSPLVASLILGSLWYAFHLPLYLPGQFFAGQPLLADIGIFLSTALLYTWLYRHTKGSVLMAVLFHGAMNASGVLYAGIDAALARWLMAAGYGALALVVVVFTGPTLTRPETELLSPAIERK